MAKRLLRSPPSHGTPSRLSGRGKGATLWRSLRIDPPDTSRTRMGRRCKDPRPRVGDRRPAGLCHGTRRGLCSRSTRARCGPRRRLGGDRRRHVHRCGRRAGQAAGRAGTSEASRPPHCRPGHPERSEAIVHRDRASSSGTRTGQPGDVRVSESPRPPADRSSNTPAGHPFQPRSPASGRWLQSPQLREFAAVRRGWSRAVSTCYDDPI